MHYFLVSSYVFVMDFDVGCIILFLIDIDFILISYYYFTPFLSIVIHLYLLILFIYSIRIVFIYFY